MDDVDFEIGVEEVVVAKIFEVGAKESDVDNFHNSEVDVGCVYSNIYQ